MFLCVTGFEPIRRIAMNVQDPSRFGAKADRPSLAPGYMSGFGNSFESEALAGALPVGRNSPQKVKFGLCRAALRLAVHRAAVDQPALLALSQPGPRSNTRRATAGST